MLLLKCLSALVTKRNRDYNITYFSSSNVKQLGGWYLHGDKALQINWS